MELKLCKNETEEVILYFFVYKMIGGTNETYYSSKTELITSNFMGIYFSDTNHPELEDKILFVYKNTVPQSVQNFFDKSKQSYNIYKEEVNNSFVYIVAFTANRKYIHDYETFKQNKKYFATIHYYNDCIKTFCSCNCAIEMFNKCDKNLKKKFKNEKKDLILNLYEVPVEEECNNSSFSFFFIFKSITQLMQLIASYKIFYFSFDVLITANLFQPGYYFEHFI